MDQSLIFQNIANRLDIVGEGFPEIIVHQGPSQVIDNIIYINNDHTRDERFHKKVLAHEMVHYLVFAKYGQLIGSLDEGIAVYIADNKFYKEAHGFTVHEFSKTLLEKDLLYKIKEVIDNRSYYGKRHDMRIDLEAASFVGFLIEGHGMDNFFSMYSTIIQPTKENPVCNIFKVIKDVYKKDIDELQKEWEEFLKVNVKENDIPKKILNGRKFDKEIRIRSTHCHGCAFPLNDGQKECPECGLAKDIIISF